MFSINNFELCYRGTSFKVQGGSVIAAFFWAHNYVSEQFGNYVVYGSNNFPRYKESLFSFQSAIGSERRSNVIHMAAILESNMAAPDVNFDIAKRFLYIENRYRHLNGGPRCNISLEQELWAKLWSFWHHIGNQYGGHHWSRIFGVNFV